MEIKTMQALRAMENRVTGRTAPAPIQHKKATAPFSQHALPHGAFRQPTVVTRKKQAVRQTVKRVVDANVPPFGLQTIPTRRQSVAKAKQGISRKRAKSGDRLLDFIKSANSRYSG